MSSSNSDLTSHSEALDSQWSDDDLARLAVHIISWEPISLLLDITEAEGEEIKRNYHGDYRRQKYELLKKWKNNRPKEATYERLINVFKCLKDRALVEKVEYILSHPGEPVEKTGVVRHYQEFLQASYQQVLHPSLLVDQWPIMKKPAIIKLCLTEQKISVNGKKYETPISLPELFSKANMPILICGLPGSGKTTLTWDVSQQWARSELFQQFKLLITIPLRSLRTQQATCLADLITHPDEEQKKVIAQAISTDHGDRVCFWFDGWDEMSTDAQKSSFVASFIKQTTPLSALPKCSIVVTSRSEASLTPSGKIVNIQNLELGQILELIVKNTENTGHDADALVTALEKKPMLRHFCSLPISVTILVHLFFTLETGLPSTQTELFKCLILNLLLRNLQTRWQSKINRLTSFDDLPQDVGYCFKALSKFAYDSIISSKLCFKSSELPDLQLPLPQGTLGLLKITPLIDWCGFDAELTFIHSTLQEFLAAIHLSTLPIKDQFKVIKHMSECDNDHMPVVLAFYAGLTQLKNKKVFKFIRIYFKKRLSYSIETSFFELLICLYETQFPELCHKIVLNKYLILNQITFSSPDLFVSSTTLFHLGYFLVHYCSINTVTVNFEDNVFTNEGFEAFVEIMISEWNILPQKPLKSKLTLRVCEDSVGKVSPLLSKLLTNTNLLSSLVLHLCLDSTFRFHTCRLKHPPMSLHSAMKPLISALSRNTSCSSLMLSFMYPFPDDARKHLFSAVVAASEYYIVLLLTFCPGIKRLTLNHFIQPFHFYYLFATAILRNRKLNYLSLDLNEGIHFDYHKENHYLLSRAFGKCRSIKTVSLQYSSFDNDDLLMYLKSIKKFRSSIELIITDVLPNEEVQEFLHLTNIRRRDQSRPLLGVAYIDEDEDYGEDHWWCYGKGVLSCDGYGVEKRCKEAESIWNDKSVWDMYNMPSLAKIVELNLTS